MHLTEAQISLFHEDGYLTIGECAGCGRPAAGH